MSKVTVMNETNKDAIRVLYENGFALKDISEQKYLIIADHEGFNNSCFLDKDVNELETFIEELKKDEEESK